MAETLLLNSGHRMPLVGLGTWQASSSEECKVALRAALDAGYRHIDTAPSYKNEEYIGELLQEYFDSGKLKRDDIFITTKLRVTHHERDRVPLCLEQSLKKLQLDYVDLYLIHMATAFRETGVGEFFPMDENNKPAFQNIKIEETWKGMEQCVKSGKAKSIGVSNFSMEQIERICNMAEIKNHVQTSQYKGDPVVLDDPVAKEIASKYKKSVAQIALRFLVERGMIVIPKSSNPKRIRENIEIFDFKLSDADFAKLEAQDKKVRLFHGDMLKVHPEYSDPGVL